MAGAPTAFFEPNDQAFLPSIFDLADARPMSPWRVCRPGAMIILVRAGADVSIIIPGRLYIRAQRSRCRHELRPANIELPQQLCSVASAVKR